MSFELCDYKLVMVLRAAHLSGMAPGEFVNIAIRERLDYLESQMEDKDDGNEEKAAPPEGQGAEWQEGQKRDENAAKPR